MRRQGTTTVEIKSGYGLTVHDEARSARDRAAGSPTRRPTSGAHVVPPEYADDPQRLRRPGHRPDARRRARRTRGGSTCSARGAPSTPTRPGRSSRPAWRRACGGGCTPTSSGPGPGCSSRASSGCVAVDHCTYLTDADVDALAQSGTVATLLPGVEFSTRSPYPDARRLLDAGVHVALASDCNPGSCYTSSMPLCIALAVREMGLTPAEALDAATRGGARALRRDDVGHLGAGARADLVVLDAPSYLHLAYRPGVPLVSETYVRVTRAQTCFAAAAPVRGTVATGCR